MRNKLLYFLPFFAALSGVNIIIGGLNVRFDQLISTILCLILAFRIIFNYQKFYLDFPGKMLISFLFISFISSYYFSPDPKYSIIQTINLTSVSSIYIILINFIDSKKMFDHFLKVYFNAGFIAITLGVALFILSVLIGNELYGVNLISDTTLAYGVYSTMREPNIFGSYSLIYFIIGLSMLLYKGSLSKNCYNITSIYFIVYALGVFLSFTRGVWLGGIAAFFLLLILSKKYSIPNSKKKIHLIKFSIIMLVLITLVLSISHSFFTYKIDNLFQAQEGTGQFRLLEWAKAIEDIGNNFLLGNGTYSFASIYSKTVPYNNLENAWIGNIFLTVLHDTGLIGFSFFMIMCVNLISKGIKLSKLAKALQKDYSIILGITISIIAMLIAFIFTTGFSYGYSWLLLGLLGVINRLFVKNISLYN